MKVHRLPIITRRITLSLDSFLQDFNIPSFPLSSSAGHGVSKKKQLTASVTVSAITDVVRLGWTESAELVQQLQKRSIGIEKNF